MGYKIGQKVFPRGIGPSRSAHGLSLRKFLIKNHATLFWVGLSSKSNTTRFHKAQHRWVTRWRRLEPRRHCGPMTKEQCCANHVVVGASRCLQPVNRGSLFVAGKSGWVVVMGLMAGSGYNFALIPVLEKERCYVHNILTTNHRWLVVIGSNLNLTLRLLFYCNNNNQ